MEKNVRFMAQELPENEMQMLYSLLGKGPAKIKSLKRKSRFWNWRNFMDKDF